MPTIAFSTTTLVSCEKAILIASLSCSSLAALLIPTEDPAFAGFTNIGKPSFSTIWGIIWSNFEISQRWIAAHFAVLIPALSKTVWVKALSMQMAEDTVSQPTNGIPAIVKSPWIVPSSPFLPWSTGNTQSIWRIEVSPSAIILIRPLWVRSGLIIAVVQSGWDSHSPFAIIETSPGK